MDMHFSLFREMDGATHQKVRAGLRYGPGRNRGSLPSRERAVLLRLGTLRSFTSDPDGQLQALAENEEAQENEGGLLLALTKRAPY